MLSVKAAQDFIQANITPLGTENLPIDQALGRILATPIHARLTQPPYDVSAMDGYVINAYEKDSYEVVADIPAGHPWQGKLQTGEAARIYTGAVIPQGATHIVIQEEAKEVVRSGATLLILTNPPQKGKWMRHAGMDFHKGEVLKQAGEIITARDIGLLVAANIAEVSLYQRPKIAIISTGDELATLGSELKAGQIINSNGPLLCAFAKLYGCEATLLPMVGDNIEEIEALARKAMDFDMVITSGGASVGKHDLVKQAFDRVGFELGFWKVAMRPGKPLIFGHIGNKPVLGLPGNPVSVAVCFLIFVLPALMKMMGGDMGMLMQNQMMNLQTPLPENDARESYWRARIIEGKVSAFKEQDSAEQVKMAMADCLIRRPPFAPALNKGDAVEVLYFPQSFIRF